MRRMMILQIQPEQLRQKLELPTRYSIIDIRMSFQCADVIDIKIEGDDLPKTNDFDLLQTQMYDGFGEEHF